MPRFNRTVGGLLIDDAGDRMYWQFQQVPLTNKQFYVVRKLLDAHGAATYQQILESYRPKGWRTGKDLFSYEANIRSMIRNIRIKFKKVDPSFDRIVNLPGVGYQWRSEDGMKAPA